jgi:hypothetical protein
MFEGTDLADHGNASNRGACVPVRNANGRPFTSGNIDARLWVGTTNHCGTFEEGRFSNGPPLVSSENCATLAHPTLPCPRLSRCPVTSVLVTPATMITRGMQRGNLEGKHAGRRGSRAMGHGGDPRTRQPFIEVLCSSGLTGPSARSVCRRELHRNAERRAERRAKGSRA